MLPGWLCLSPEREATRFPVRVAQVGPQPPSIVEIAIPFERNVRRYPTNYVGTVVKAVVDGLVSAGLWSDDTPEFVTVVQPMLEIGSDVTVRLLRRPD